MNQETNKKGNKMNQETNKKGNKMNQEPTTSYKKEDVELLFLLKESSRMILRCWETIENNEAREKFLKDEIEKGRSIRKSIPTSDLKAREKVNEGLAIIEQELLMLNANWNHPFDQIQRWQDMAAVFDLHVPFADPSEYEYRDEQYIAHDIRTLDIAFVVFFNKGKDLTKKQMLAELAKIGSDVTGDELDDFIARATDECYFEKRKASDDTGSDWQKSNTQWTLPPQN